MPGDMEEMLSPLLGVDEWICEPPGCFSFSLSLSLSLSDFFLPKMAMAAGYGSSTQSYVQS